MKAGLEIRPRSEIAPAVWDSFVKASPDGYIFGLTAWLDMIEPIWLIQDVSFAVVSGEEILALIPMHRIDVEKRLAASGWGWCGPMFAPDLSGAQQRKAATALMDTVRELALRHGCRRLDTAHSPLTRRSLENRWGVNPLLSLGFQDTSTHSRIIDLRVSEDELWKGLAKNARYAVKRALKLGYTAGVEEWLAHVDEYYAAHRETYARTGATCIDKRYFQGMAEKTAPLGISRLIVGRAPDGSVAAFHNDGCFLDTVWYHTGCGFTRHLDSGLSYLLMWTAILEAKRNGGQWFETGEVFLSAQGGKEESLSLFKSRFGGETHRSFRGALVFERGAGAK